MGQNRNGRSLLAQAKGEREEARWRAHRGSVVDLVCLTADLADTERLMPNPKAAYIVIPTAVDYHDDKSRVDAVELLLSGDQDTLSPLTPVLPTQI